MFGSVNVANAQGFQGTYAPSNWNFSSDVGGSVNTTNAPNSISLTSGNSFSGGDTTYTITAPADGTVSFNWSFNSSDLDSPFYDPFGYLLNGSFVQLSNDAGASIQNGTTTFMVMVGDIFGFNANTLDGEAGSATTTISNFQAPEASPVSTPEPTSVVVLIGVGVLGVAGKLKKKS